AGLSGSRRAARLIGKRQTPAAPSRRGRRRLVGLRRVANRPVLVAAGPRAAGPARRRATRTMRTRTAACLLVVMAVSAALLTWATVSIARRAMASEAAGGGSLVIPPPKLAAGLPMRPGEAGEPGAGPIVTVLRQRFGAVGAALIADARRAARAAANGASPSPVTATWTSGLYGQPGHLDPITLRPAWVMYLGLDASGTLGLQADVIGHLMLGILGPNSKVGPWPVAAGHRGGTANCTVAWLPQTSVAVCGWTNGHTIGALASPTRDTSVTELAALMAKMRFDLQNP